jgi:hypothetical protein
VDQVSSYFLHRQNLNGTLGVTGVQMTLVHM